MLRIHVGDDIPLTDAKLGKTNEREWMMIVLKAEKGYDSIALFVDNVAEAKNYTTAKVLKITEVQKSNQKVGDKYYDRFSCHVVLEGVDGNAALKASGFDRFQSAVQKSMPSGDGFMPMPEGDDGLPFA